MKSFNFTSKDLELVKLSNDCARWNRLERERQGTIDQMNSPYSEDDFLHNFALLVVDAA